MQLHLLDTGFFKLDGGAMFGVVPQSIWKKLNAPDENNMCTWAMRCLLIEDNNQITLVDTGIGNKQDPKFFKHYFIHGEESLKGSLQKAGLSEINISNVFLTHMHFDHVGGAISRIGEQLIPTFSNATYWSNESHWELATNPNPREKASFLEDNILPIKNSGQLKFTNQDAFKQFEYIEMNGHTERMMLPKIRYKNKVLVFVSDLIPSTGHIPLPYIMSYDVRPLESMIEKRAFLEDAAKNNWILIFQHDPVIECCTVKFSEKGIVLDESFKFNEIT